MQITTQCEFAISLSDCSISIIVCLFIYQSNFRGKNSIQNKPFFFFNCAMLMNLSWAHLWPIERCSIDEICCFGKGSEQKKKKKKTKRCSK